jgi:hypothetical protein
MTEAFLDNKDVNNQPKSTEYSYNWQGNKEEEKWAVNTGVRIFITGSRMIFLRYALYIPINYGKLNLN